VPAISSRPPEALDLDRTERVLAKLGFAAPPAPTSKGLTELYHAWCRRVPFDNVRKLIHLTRADPGVLPGDRPADFFDAWLRFGAGGTCWAGNGALHALLLALGFDAQRAIATMLVAPDIPPNHGSVVVTIDEGPVVVDASILHGAPLAMRRDEASRIDHPAWGVDARWVDGAFRIRWRNFVTRDWMDCAFDAVHVSGAAFAERHEATRAWSPFNYGLSVNLIRGNGRIGASFGSLMAFDETGRLDVRPTDHAGRMRFLVEEVGMSEELVARLPDDVPMPAPPRPA